MKDLNQLRLNNEVNKIDYPRHFCNLIKFDLEPEDFSKLNA
jgi:hypothetical protein